MKRLAFIIGGVSLFAWGMSGALTACGGDDGSVATDTDAGNTSSSGGSSSGATSSSGGSSGTPSDGGDGGVTDGGDGGDAGGDGGGASNPGKISCGATECTAGTQICCRSFGGDAGCISGNNCPGGGTELECDEKGDCQGGDLCCRGFQGQTECKSNCGNFETAVCKSNAECADGGTCKEWSCPGNLMLRSCTMPFQGCN